VMHEGVMMREGAKTRAARYRRAADALLRPDETAALRAEVAALRERVAALEAALKSAAARMSWWLCGDDCPHKNCDAGCDGADGAECWDDVEEGESPGDHLDDCPSRIAEGFREALAGGTSALSAALAAERDAATRSRDVEWCLRFAAAVGLNSGLSAPLAPSGVAACVRTALADQKTRVLDDVKARVEGMPNMSPAPRGVPLVTKFDVIAAIEAAKPKPAARKAAKGE